MAMMRKKMAESCRYFVVFGIALSLLIGGALFNGALAQSAFSDPSVAASQGGGDNSAPAAATLVAVEAEVDAGEMKIGTSVQTILRFRNESNKSISLRDVNVYPSSNVAYDLTLNQCAQDPVEPGAECAVIVLVRALQDGDFRIPVLLRHTGRSRLATGVIKGSVDEPEEEDEGLISTDITPQPGTIDFGTLSASRPIIRSVTLRNVLSEAVDIENIYIDAPGQSGFDLRTDCEKLMPSQACIASIVWSPIVTGPSSGFLVLEHTGPSRVTNVELIGEFSPETVSQAEVFPSAVPGKGLLVSSLTEVDFGGDISSLSAITVSLVNVGDAPLMLTGISLSASDNGLKLARKGCVDGRVLDPTEACPLTVAWSPSRVGSILDDIRIEHTGARGILILPVRGDATEAVSLDTKPVFTIEGITEEELEDPVPLLDGFVVTSLAGSHAIIAGPGGSRIVSDQTPILISGVEWKPTVTARGVELRNGKNKIILVFDRSLSTKSAAGGSSTSSTSENE